jgi:transposase
MAETKVVCGIDLAQASLVACLLKTEPDERATKEWRTFAMTHADLQQLKDWLVAEGCQKAGMEATGVYWKPVHQILEGTLKVIVGNAAHMKGLKGRKTDKIDAEWIARKVRDDEIIPSFIPDEAVRELRGLHRLRWSVMKTRTQIRLAVQKMLHAAGIPLANCFEDLFGVSGMGILQALAAGEPVLDRLDELVKGKSRDQLAPIRLALEVPLNATQRWELKFQLDRMARVDEDLAKVEQEMEPRLVPFEKTRLGLITTPGIGRDSAGFILAEIGTDLSEFPTGDHFAVWTGTGPGNNQTGGFSKPAKTRKGGRYLRSLLVECAHAASRTKGCWLRQKFQALRKRMPHNKALVVIAHKIALIIYHIIKDGAVYRDQEAGYIQGRSKTTAMARAIKLIQARGGQVVLPDGFPEIPIRPRGRPRKTSLVPKLAPASA